MWTKQRIIHRYFFEQVVRTIINTMIKFNSRYTLVKPISMNISSNINIVTSSAYCLSICTRTKRRFLISITNDTELISKDITNGKTGSTSNLACIYANITGILILSFDRCIDN